MASKDTAATSKFTVTVFGNNTSDVEAFVAECFENFQKASVTGFSGVTRVPTKTLRITTRRAPSGNGSETWDKYTLSIHKRMFKVECTKATLAKATENKKYPNLHVQCGEAN